MENDETTEDKWGWVPLSICFVAVVGYQLYLIRSANQNETLVKSDYLITYGKILEYLDLNGGVNGSDSRQIRYSYSVGNVRYDREIVTELIFPECEEPLSEACQAKTFWVIYSKIDPSKSLINFEVDIKGDTALSGFHEKVDDFY
ncbi:hypothetical protein SAMN04488109_4985 [Chryseolinea serpens]|uniref:Uncharacterized protein n=1 Tax=Chryseolinea serpens TaxID=947013 RepID=A0A1M5VBM5_9BACT|nr:hypothetical protein [Chryseolinea serpens]SHH72640.1 hypothetical protein SAMN04488109_4985 [Chryseolinea serpens]